MDFAETAAQACTMTSAWAGPVATAVAACIALVTLIVARWYYVRTLIGKLNDRLFELNKLGVQYPKIAKLFFAQASRSRPYFKRLEEEKDDDFYAVRSYALFRLNVYEEAFFATQGLFASSTDEGRAWQNYIADGCRHPLVAEVFEMERAHLGPRFGAFISAGTLPNGETYAHRPR